MSKNYTPSLEELSREYGERYFELEVGKRHRPHECFTEFGTLEDIIDMIETTIYGIDPDATDLEAWSARISYMGRELVTMRDCAGPDSAEVVPQPAGDTWEIRQVDALPDDENGWYYNETHRLGSFTTTAENPAKAFHAALARLGIRFTRGATRTEYDGDVCEIIDRRDGMPLFCAIPQEV